MSDTIEKTFKTAKDAFKNPKDNLMAFEGGGPNLIGLYKQGEITEAKQKEANAAAALNAAAVEDEAKKKYEADQAAAAAAAQERLIAMRMRKQNRSGTLLTTPGTGAQTLG